MRARNWSVARRWGKTPEARRSRILEVLRGTAGNVAAAAKILRTSRQLLHWHVRDLGLGIEVAALSWDRWGVARTPQKPPKPPSRPKRDPGTRQRLEEVLAALRRSHGRSGVAARMLGLTVAGGLWRRLDNAGLRGEPARMRERYRRRYRFGDAA